MLNCVQVTSVRAAVVLSVGLLRLVSRAWVVEVVLGVVLVLLLDVEAGIPPAVGDVIVVLVVVVVDEDVLGMGAFAVPAGEGISRGVSRVQLCVRASPVKPGAQNWHCGPVVLLMQRRQRPVSG